MKRILICAAAAIVALASCSKTQVVYNDAPEEIGFKAVTGVMTKAVQTTDAFTQTIGVIAYNSSTTTDPSVYFTNAMFSKTTSGTPAVTTWNGSKYWPIDSELDFMVYSPHQETGSPATVVATNTTESKTLAITVSQPSTDAINNQVDYMYSDSYITNKDKNDVSVAVNFKHALAQVTVNFTGNENVTLNTALLKETAQSGTYTVQYLPEVNPMITWAPGNSDQDLTLAPTDATELSSDPISTSYLVVPTAASSIDINYTMKGSGSLDKNIDLGENWEAGKHYIYDVSISANEIKFTVTVTPMADGDITSDTDIN